jgi:hypothetical protein
VGERDDARREIEQKRERVSDIAHEVSRRMTPAYAKERAREMARDTMWRTRERAVESSWLGPLLGAGVGALVARALQSRARERQWARGDSEEELWRQRGRPTGYAGYAPAHEEWDEYGTAALPEEHLGGDGGGSDLGAKASEVKDRAREKAAHVKERARETADAVKGRFHDAASSMTERLPDRERLRASAREDTGLWALGAMALGALFGFALPETRRERELLEPARRKAREVGQQAKEMALEKGTAAMEKATEKIGSAGEQPRAGGAPPSPEPPTAIH